MNDGQANHTQPVSMPREGLHDEQLSAPATGRHRRGARSRVQCRLCAGFLAEDRVDGVGGCSEGGALILSL